MIFAGVYVAKLILKRKSLNEKTSELLGPGARRPLLLMQPADGLMLALSWDDPGQTEGGVCG